MGGASSSAAPWALNGCGGTLPSPGALLEEDDDVGVAVSTGLADADPLAVGAPTGFATGSTLGNGLGEGVGGVAIFGAGAVLAGLLAMIFLAAAGAGTAAGAAAGVGGGGGGACWVAG